MLDAMRALRLPLPDELLRLLPVASAEGLVDFYAVEVTVHPHRAAAAPVLPTLRVVRTMLLVSSIDSQHKALVYLSWYYLKSDIWRCTRSITLSGIRSVA